MVPDLRPSRPLSTGPTLFLAPSPTAWQGRHFLNEFSPAARSWLNAACVIAARIPPAASKSFMSSRSFAVCKRTWSGPPPADNAVPLPPEGLYCSGFLACLERPEDVAAGKRGAAGYSEILDPDGEIRTQDLQSVVE